VSCLVEHLSQGKNALEGGISNEWRRGKMGGKESFSPGLAAVARKSRKKIRTQKNLNVRERILLWVRRKTEKGCPSSPSWKNCVSLSIMMGGTKGKTECYVSTGGLQKWWGLLQSFGNRTSPGRGPQIENQKSEKTSEVLQHRRGGGRGPGT